MHVLPAIDIRGGRVARVARSGAARETIYHGDPVAVAERYASQGARWIHVVDLDRVLGSGDQAALIARLAARVPVSVQVGGGLVEEPEIAAMFECGVARVIVGLRSAAEPERLEALVARLGAGRLGLAVDVAGGRGWSERWPGASALTAVELAGRAAAAGLGLVSHTDIGREGLLEGADLEGAAAVSGQAGVAVLVSGGVTSLAEVGRIRDAGLAGVIVGRALLEGRFTLPEALACSSLP